MKMNSLMLFLFLSFLSVVNASLTTEQRDMIANAMQRLNPVFDINEAVVEEFHDLNLYKVISHKNLEVFFLSMDGRYFFYGDLLDLKEENKKDRNITELSKRFIRKTELNKFPKKEMIIFSPDRNSWGFRKPLGVITVFTDLTCPYGNRLHKEVEKAVKDGLEVRYVFFPRSGIDSEGYKKAVSVWCSKNRNQAFALATEGKDPINNECKKNPVKEHFSFAQRIGIQATPSIVLSDGSLIPGYVTSDQLINFVKSN